MTPDQFRAALDAFGLTQHACARFLGVDERNVRRWAAGDGPPIPKSVAALFVLMDEFSMSPEEVDKMVEADA